MSHSEIVTDFLCSWLDTQDIKRKFIESRTQHALYESHSTNIATRARAICLIQLNIGEGEKMKSTSLKENENRFHNLRKTRVYC